MSEESTPPDVESPAPAQAAAPDPKPPKKSKPSSNKPAPAPAPAVEERPRGLDLMRSEHGLPPQDFEKPPAPRAPFEVGARIRYAGADRLLQGWQGHEVLAPGLEVSITETIGTCSVFRIPNTTLRALIDADEASDWAVVEQ